MQDPETRLYTLPYSNGTMDMPMSRRDSSPLNTMVDMEWLGPSIPLNETHDQLGGNFGLFCYIYV